MLKYSGTDDSIVATIGTQEWIETLNRTVKRPWSEYKLANSTQIAGFWQEYEGLTFATIRSAGHMVPTDKPEAAFHVIS
jgi:carboxypeptidase C (cathepsin A)